MNVQQAQQLTAEAETLCDNLAAAACEADEAGERGEAARILTIRRMAVRRWGRRLELWAVAAYGHGVLQRTTGTVTQRGPAIQHRGVTVQLPAARTPAGEWIARTVAAIDAGEIAECTVCGRFACECEPDADPHGDLSVFSNLDLPY